MTDSDYNRLLNDLGENEVERCIAYIDEAAQSTGNKNKWRDWNLVVRRCHRDGWGLREQGGKEAEYEILFSLVERKIQPLADKIRKEFHRSEEYKARHQLEKVEEAHQEAKKKFGERYGVDPDEYDYCYNIFGDLMEEYLNKIIRQQQEAYRSYREYYRSTYGGGDSRSYSTPSVSTYTESEAAILKQFYRSLSKAYHPDLNPGKDTTAEMQLLNKLKEGWGI